MFKPTTLRILGKIYRCAKIPDMSGSNAGKMTYMTARIFHFI